VQVAQSKPGRLVIRGLRSDPLTRPFPMGEAPQGVYGSSSVQAPLRVYLGRDEWGSHRWAGLAGLTGITVAGLPGAGKTSLIQSLLCQLAKLPVVFVFIDGKGGGDYADWTDRAWLSVGDELPAAAGTLEDVHALMRQRFGTVQEITGHRNAWHAGPTPEFPLVVTVIDECHTFFDLDAVKGKRDAEAHVRACRALTGQLVKKGRSVLMLTILITQKQTADAIPTAIRDNCGLGLSFAVKTRDAAVAALGETIRDYLTYCATLLQGPDYIGVATVSLRTGHDPFVRIRCPQVTEADAREHALRAAGCRLDPTALPAGRGVVSTRLSRSR
jgi:S-DNA-T family DNA segregation ATPase FtsK/SpoIIIE